MMSTLIVTFLRQRARSPFRVLLAALMILPAVPFAIFSGSLSPVAGAGAALALVFAAGAIGQEISSGVLQLVFARPVTRAEFVFARWLACGGAVSALTLLQLLLATAGLLAHGAHVLPMEVLTYWLEDVLAGFAAAAFVLNSIAGTLAQFKHWEVLHRASDEILATMQPHPDLSWLAGHGDPAFASIAVVTSTTAIALAVAMTRLSRRELSYAD
jgi:ABC-type Na+ efflux pump permease subunit